MFSYLMSLIIFAAAMCLIYYDLRALIMHNRATRSIGERAAVYLTIVLGCVGIIVCIMALVSLVLTALQKHYFGAGLFILGGIYLGCGLIGGFFTRTSLNCCAPMKQKKSLSPMPNCALY